MALPSIAEISFEDRSTDPPQTGVVRVSVNQTIKIGRDPDQNTVVFSDPAVSRNHLEFYSIVVDEDGRHSPLVFVRDRQSFNGTYVNNQLIARGLAVSPGRLLQDGDIIEIKPFVTIRFIQLQTAPTSFHLSSHQQEEAALFADKYTITDRTLGDGAHALVYLATETRTGKQVVCKVHNLTKGPRSFRKLQRVRQEAMLLSYLDHPNILSIKAAFQTHQSMYIFTELATGGDLFSLFTRYQVFEEIEIRWIVRQVLRAVVYLHTKGVAHRDIKPENILCAIAPSAAYRIVLSDFGDSAMMSGGRMRSEVGTTFYRAPECYTPEQGHNLSVDIWAVGMLTLQLFAGSQELPELFRMGLGSQDKVDEYLDKTLGVIYPLGQISSDGQGFIRGCLVYDSEQRLTVCEAFGHDWLQKPRQDKQLFKRLESESASPWEPRGVMLPVIEDLTAESREIGGNLGNAEAMDTISRHFATRGDVSPLGTNASNRHNVRLCRGEIDQIPLPRKPSEFRSLSPTSLRAVARRLGVGKRRSVDGKTGSPKRRRPNSL